MTHPIDLDDLVQHTSVSRPWRAELVMPEIGGGRLSIEHLRALDAMPDALALQVSGLDQRLFEQLIHGYGARFRGLHFWKCPRIADFTPLEGLSQLTHVAIYWNQRATRLWDLMRTPALRGLKFEDFTRLHDLSDLKRGTSLVELDFGDAIWRTSVFESLEPLRSLTGLRRLAICPRRVQDGRIEPLGALQELEALAFPANLFSTEQVAWLRARLPARVDAPFLGAVRHFPRSANDAPGAKDVLVIGRRKPWLSSSRDGARIKRYEDAFAAEVARCLADPTLTPEPVT